MSSRRTRHRFDPRAGASSAPAAEIVSQPARLLTVTATDGSSRVLDLSRLPADRLPGLIVPIQKAVALDVKRRTLINANSLRTVCRGIEEAALLLVNACIASGVTRPQEITAALVNAAQQALHGAGYTPKSVLNRMNYLASILNLMVDATDPSLAARLNSPYSLKIAPDGEESPKGYTPSEPYSKREAKRIFDYCRKMVRESHRRLIGDAAALLGEAQDPRLDPSSHVTGWRSLSGVAWELAHNGPGPQAELLRRSGASQAWFRGNLRQPSVAEIYYLLFPKQVDVVPAYWLLCLLTGIEPYAAQSLIVEEVTGSVAVYLKPRSGKPAEVRDLSPDAQRLVVLVLEMTALARRWASAEHRDRLWLHLVPTGRRKASVQPYPFDGNGFALLNLGHGLLDDPGEPLRINAQRLRTTHIQARKKLDPHPDQSHTAQVDLAHYTLNKSNAPMLQSVAESGIEAARREARRPLLLVGSDARAESSRFVLPGPSADSFVGACNSPLESPFTKAGAVCSADPWMCFRCDNCRIGERHLPNLLAWRRWMEEQHEFMPDEDWRSQWGESYLILTHEILPAFSDAQLATAQPLSREIDPTLWMPMKAVMERFTVTGTTSP